MGFIDRRPDYGERCKMQKTTMTISEPVAETLKVYTAQTKSSMHAQSRVVEEALVEFFEKRNVKIEE